MSASAAGLAPFVGGFGQDFFARREFELILRWTGELYRGDMLHLSVRAWEFYFLLSALVGLYALHRLTLVRETGELARRDLLAEMRQQSLVRHYVADGLTLIAELPANLLRRGARQRPEER